MILGLEQITFAELRSSERLMEALRGKLADLDLSRCVDQELARKVLVLIDLLRETLLDRYQATTVRAFAHIVVALDYFLTLHEREPDSVRDTLPGGYSDDLRRVLDVHRQFEREIQEFVAWRARQPE